MIYTPTSTEYISSNIEMIKNKNLIYYFTEGCLEIWLWWNLRFSDDYELILDT